MGLETFRLLVSCIGVCTGVTGVSLALWRQYRGFRWKQVEAGASLVDDLFGDQEADAALKMIDERTAAFKIGSDEEMTISRDDIIAALSVRNAPGDGKSIYIRRGFDALAYYLVRAEDYVQIKLARREDIAPLLEYSVLLLGGYRPVLEPYFTKIKHEKAIRFLEHFEAWNRTKVT